MNLPGSTLKITTIISAVLLVTPLTASGATFLDLDSITPGTAGIGSFTGTLGDINVNGSLLSGGNSSYRINVIGTNFANSVIDNSSLQYSYSNIYTPSELLSDQVGMVKGGTTGTATLRVDFSKAITNPIFHTTNQDRLVYDFSPSGLTLVDLTLLSGNGGDGDGLALHPTNPWIVDANPDTSVGVVPSVDPPITGSRSAYGSIQLQGTFTTLTIGLLSNPDNTDAEGLAFTISIADTLTAVPEPSPQPLVMLSAISLFTLGMTFRKKLSQSKNKV